jgi:hypothetical protein
VATLPFPLPEFFPLGHVQYSTSHCLPPCQQTGLDFDIEWGFLSIDLIASMEGLGRKIFRKIIGVFKNSFPQFRRLIMLTI